VNAYGLFIPLLSAISPIWMLISLGPKTVEKHYLWNFEFIINSRRNYDYRVLKVNSLMSREIIDFDSTRSIWLFKVSVVYSVQPRSLKLFFSVPGTSKFYTNSWITSVFIRNVLSVLFIGKTFLFRITSRATNKGYWQNI